MDVFYPLQKISDFITFEFLGLVPKSYLANAANFWIYDLLKISLLLVLINYFMAITRFYFPMERARDLLTQRRWHGAQYLLAAILGVVTPFCSCSSIPLFMGFLSAGIPLGVTFTFLITSPLVNEASLFIFPSIFGWKITFVYNAIGIFIGVFGGAIIQKLKLEKYVQPEMLMFSGRKKLQEKYKSAIIPLNERLRLWTVEMWDITKTIYPYIVLGVTLGAIIHGFVPESLVENILSHEGLLSVPLAVILGVPLYANSVSIIPIIEALIGKGISMGTALAFMTATVTLSIPEALMLKKVLKWQLMVIFFSITVIGIIFMGYLFNLFV